MALENGKLTAAAIDVYEREPSTIDNPLFKVDNILTTPHTAAETYETYHDIGQVPPHSAFSTYSTARHRRTSCNSIYPVQRVGLQRQPHPFFSSSLLASGKRMATSSPASGGVAKRQLAATHIDDASDDRQPQAAAAARGARRFDLMKASKARPFRVSAAPGP